MMCDIRKRKKQRIGVACIKVELTRQNRKAGATLFAMNKITQTALYRQALITYAKKYGVTKAAIRYRTYRQYICVDVYEMFTYNTNGTASKRQVFTAEVNSIAYDTVGSTIHDYVSEGGRVVADLTSNNTLIFGYDESGHAATMSYNGTTYYYITNIQGDVLKIVNSSGTAVATYTYNAWGELLSSSGSLAAVNPIRYRTHNLSRIIPGECPCGSRFPRLDAIMGRTDDMIKIKGVNVFPSQIEEILSGFPEVSSEYQIRISHLDGKDAMRIYVETNGSVDFLDLAKRVAATVKSRIGFTPLVKVVEIGLLPRSEKKTKRVIDERYD